MSAEQDPPLKGIEAETIYSAENSDNSSIEIILDHCKLSIDDDSSAVHVATRKSSRLNHHKPSIDDDSTLGNPTASKIPIILQNGSKPDCKLVANLPLISQTLTHKIEDSSDDKSHANTGLDNSLADDNEQLNSLSDKV